ncbi:hypothetical protein ACMFMG_007562 [Clarireedia jacksonii]
MKYFAVQIIAFLAAGAFALPGQSTQPNQIEARDACKNTMPACYGGNVVGKTNCRCDGQHYTDADNKACDVWVCPGYSTNVAVCGGDGTGCVWI